MNKMEKEYEKALIKCKELMKVHDHPRSIYLETVPPYGSILNSYHLDFEKYQSAYDAATEDVLKVPFLVEMQRNFLVSEIDRLRKERSKEANKYQLIMVIAMFLILLLLQF